MHGEWSAQCLPKEGVQNGCEHDHQHALGPAPALSFRGSPSFHWLMGDAEQELTQEITTSTAVHRYQGSEQNIVV